MFFDTTGSTLFFGYRLTKLDIPPLLEQLGSWVKTKLGIISPGYVHTSGMYAAEKERKKNNERVPTRYLLGGGQN